MSEGTGQPTGRRGRARRRSRKPPPGSTPGALAEAASAEPSALRALWYDGSRQGERALAGPGEIPELLADPSLTVWIDVEGVGDLGGIRELGRVLEIHPLAIADIVNVPQRSKVELYGDRLLFVCHQAMTGANGELELEQVSLVLGPGWVLSVGERPGDVFDPVRERIRSPQTRIRGMRADFLAYALIDAVVDGYFAVIERIGEELDALEDEIVERPTRGTLERMHAVRRRLLQLHRLQWRQRDAIATLWRDESLPITEPVRLYLRDVHDHAFVVLDAIETFRDLAASLMDVHLSAASNRLNEVMKTLTLVATIFIPLTFIAGVYGMNFDWMPELRWRFGYPAVWAVMLAVGAGLYVWFRRRNWL